MLTIKLNPGPDAAEGVIRAVLEQIYQDKSSAGILQKTNPDDLRIGAHHQVFDLDTKHILAGSGLAAARLSTSRYLIVQGKKAVAAAEVTVDAAGDEVSFNLINVGPFVEGFSKAVRKAESLPHDGDYACHLLRIAPLYVMALWLEPLDGGETIIVPIKPAPDFLLTAASYSEEDFLSALKQPAKDLDTRI